MSEPIVRDFRAAKGKKKPMKARKKRSTKKAAHRDDNPAKKRAKKRKSPAKKRAAKRRSHARKPARRRARKHNMTERQGDKRYKRRRARKNSPTRSRSRKHNMTSRQGDRRYARKRRHHRRDNPLGIRLGNPTGNWGNIVTLGVASLGGYILAEFTDRFVATRAGAKSPNGGKDAFTGAQAITEISAPPDGMRYGAQGALSLLFLVGGFYAAKKKHDTIAYIATGMGIGASVHMGAQIWYDSIVPAIAKKSTDPKTPSFLGDRIYPDLDKDALDAASKAAKALRAAGHQTLGAPQRRQQAMGPQGQPRVAQRPAQTVGCGTDYGQAALIQQLKQQNDALAAQIAAMRAGRVADGPETRPEPPKNNITPIQKTFAAYA